MALKLAVEQAKREEDELKEEEANNPMKLLGKFLKYVFDEFTNHIFILLINLLFMNLIENRTEQSRNEIELLESLEELKDLNRRQAAIDYDSMLQQYVGETAEQRIKREEQEDEDFLKCVFDFNKQFILKLKPCIIDIILNIYRSVKFQNKSSGSKIVLAEEIIEEIEDESVPPLAKRIKTEPDTDNVTSIIKQRQENVQKSFPKAFSKNNESWSKSVGSLSNKKGLSGLVKIIKKSENKNIATPSSTSTSTCASVDSEQKDQNKSNIQPKAPSTNGLSLLAGYSDSDSNEDS